MNATQNQLNSVDFSLQVTNRRAISLLRQQENFWKFNWPRNLVITSMLQDQSYGKQLCHECEIWSYPYAPTHAYVGSRTCLQMNMAQARTYISKVNLVHSSAGISYVVDSKWILIGYDCNWLDARKLSKVHWQRFPIEFGWTPGEAVGKWCPDICVLPWIWYKWK